MAAKDKRVEGQIWIDREFPNRLKYFVNEKEYIVKVDQLYPVDPGLVDDLYPGLVVKLDNKGNVVPAIFPDDIDRVIGVIGQINRDVLMVSILKSDDLYLKKSDLNHVMVDIEDIESLITGIDDKEKIIGAPVYWFIGRTKKNGSEYTYIDSTTHRGCITFNTPSGLQWKKTSLDEEFDISYDNLPMLGTVTDCALVKSSEEGKFKISTLNITLNYSGFDKNMSWSWPYLRNGLKEPEGRIVSIDVRHGLFSDTVNLSDKVSNHTIKIKPRCFCDVIALNGETDDTEYKVSCIVDNFYGLPDIEGPDNDKRTHIEMHTAETFRYSIHGTVVYGFDKEVNNG